MNFTKIPAEQIFRLSDYIVAKPGLVISKNVCDTAGLNMTLYSFGGGEGITWQTIPGDLLLTVLEGEAFLETDVNGSETAGEGMAIFVKGGERFQISGNKPYKLNFSVVNKNGEKDMFIKNFEQSKVVTLKDQIAVEEGTIVSKTLVNREDLTMTLFAFDKGQGVSTHAAPGDAMIVCLEGKADVVLNGENLQIKAGESLIMPAQAPHSVKAAEPYKMLLTVVKA